MSKLMSSGTCRKDITRAWWGWGKCERIWMRANLGVSVGPGVSVCGWNRNDFIVPKTNPIFLLSLLLLLGAGEGGGGAGWTCFLLRTSVGNVLCTWADYCKDGPNCIFACWLPLCSCECVSMLYFLCIGSLLAHSQWNIALFCNTKNKTKNIDRGVSDCRRGSFSIQPIQVLDFLVLFLH